MGVAAVVLLMVYWPEVQVSFQLPVGTLYLADKVVVVPGRAPVYGGHVGTQEVHARAAMYHREVLYLPSHFRHLGMFLLIAHVFDVVETGDGRITLDGTAGALHHLLVALRSSLPGYGGVDFVQFALEAFFPHTVH